MKIVCIGKNYDNHAREMGDARPAEPVVFMKPATALLPAGAPFTVPAFSNEVHHEIEVVVRVSRRARQLEAHDAVSAIDGVTVGLDFTARDVQRRLRNAGHPWEKAKAFDGAAAVGAWRAPSDLPALDALPFHLERNGVRVQVGTTADLIFPIPTLLAHVTSFVTLEAGDLLFTGTPSGVGPIISGDRLVGHLAGEELLTVEVA